MNWCWMSKKSGKIVDFLLLHCEIARALWVDWFSFLELDWVMLSLVLCIWLNVRGIPQITLVWKMVPVCIRCCLWQERIDRTFKEKECSLEEIRFLFARTLFL